MTLTDISHRTYTIDEYFAKEEQAEYKYEFNNGKLKLMPGGSNKHADIAGNIYVSLRSKLKKRKDVFKVYNMDARIILPSSNRTLYSDAFVANKPLKEFIRKDIGQGILNPCFVVEVLSKRTAAYDRGDKFRKYKTIPSLREYVLIEQNSAVVDVFTKGEEGWNLKTFEELESIAKFPTLGIEIPLADIYEDVDFKVKEEAEEA